MRFKNVLYSIYLFVILIGTTSCNQKAAGQSTSVSKTTATDQVPAVADSLSKFDYLRNFKTRQLGERKFLIQPGDTIDLPKPMLKLFTGKVEGKQVQFWLSVNMSMGEEANFSQNSLGGTWYMDGDADLTGVNVDQSNQYKGTIYADREEQIARYTFIFDTKANEVEISKDNKRFILKESELRFEALHYFKYQNLLCQGDTGTDPYLVSHWEYNYDFALNPVSSKQAKDPLSKQFVRTFESKLRFSGTNWQYDVAQDVLYNTKESDEVDICNREFYERFHKPLYLDSLIFVTIDYGYVDLGGAHGMYSAEYKTFDMTTGKEIELSEVLDTSADGFEAYHFKKVKTELYSGESDDFSIGQLSQPSSFYLLPTGIGFHYPGYSLGGGFWTKEVFLPYDEIRPYLKTDKYFRR